VPIGQEVRPGRALKKAKKKRKKEEKKKRTNAIPTKVVMWGGVPDVVNHAKFHQNRFRGFGSPRGQILLFSYL